MKRKLTILGLGWALLVAGTLRAQSGSDVQIKVVVLDARSGKPQSNVKLHYWCMPDAVNAMRSEEQTVETNADGIAEVPYCKDTENLGIVAMPTDHKEQCGVMPNSLKADLIAAEGVIFSPGANAGLWCPTTISKKLKATPGQITIFVKKPTWWQSHFPG